MIRVWDKRTKTMWDNVAQINYKLGKPDSVIYANHLEMQYITVRKDDFVLMPSSGPKDKNDAELFKGDIVKWSQMDCDSQDSCKIYQSGDNETLSKCILFGKEKTCEKSFEIFSIGYVYLEQTDCFSGWAVRPIKEHEKLSFVDCEWPQAFKWNEIEIIGNKHKNPELLEC